MADRVASLEKLLDLAAPVSVAATELASHTWDSTGPFVALLPKHIVGVLARFIAGNVSAVEVEAWANAVECREDIQYLPSSPAGVVLHELANPMLTRPLTLLSAQARIATLSGNAT